MTGTIALDAFVIASQVGQPRTPEPTVEPTASRHSHQM